MTVARRVPYVEFPDGSTWPVKATSSSVTVPTPEDVVMRGWFAARAYVAARLRNEAAEPCDWTACAAEVDRTWHELVEAAMPPDPETGAK